MALGSIVAIVITVFAFNRFNIYSNPSFEPFFSPWPWFIIYLITNVIQLMAMTIITFGVRKIFKLNLSTVQYKYFLVGFFFSTIYIIGLTFIVTEVEKLNNYLFAFAIYPIVIYASLILSMKLIKK